MRGVGGACPRPIAPGRWRRSVCGVVRFQFSGIVARGTVTPRGKRCRRAVAGHGGESRDHAALDARRTIEPTVRGAARSLVSLRRARVPRGVPQSLAASHARNAAERSELIADLSGPQRRRMQSEARVRCVSNVCARASKVPHYSRLPRRVTGNSPRRCGSANVSETGHGLSLEASQWRRRLWRERDSPVSWNSTLAKTPRAHGLGALPNRDRKHIIRTPAHLGAIAPYALDKFPCSLRSRRPEIRFTCVDPIVHGRGKRSGMSSGWTMRATRGPFRDAVSAHPCPLKG